MNEKAFPQRINDDSGMDMRDYFAAKIAVAMYQELSDDEDWDFESVASCAYEFADAMIKARKKSPYDQCTVEEAFGI